MINGLVVLRECERGAFMIQPMQCSWQASYHHALNGIIRNGIIDLGDWKWYQGTIPDSVKGMFSTGHFWLWVQNVTVMTSWKKDVAIERRKISHTQCGAWTKYVRHSLRKSTWWAVSTCTKVIKIHWNQNVNLMLTPYQSRDITMAFLSKDGEKRMKIAPYMSS